MALDRYIEVDGVLVLENDPHKWNDYMRGRDHRIAKTHITPIVYVSTIFLGIDHNFSGEGLPLLYETMIFGGPRNHQESWHATRAEALVGHQAVVEAEKLAQTS